MEQECINSETALADIAGQIRGLEKQNIANVIEIGRLLREAQMCCPHGKWMKWVETQFAWSDQTLRRYIKAYKLSKQIDVTGLNLSISALHIVVDLHAARRHEQVYEILTAAETSRVTKKIALLIAEPPFVESPPVAPPASKKPRSRLKADRARASLFGLCRAIKYPLKDWEDAAQSVPPVQLRTIIDRLELIYQTRTASRFEDVN